MRLAQMCMAGSGKTTLYQLDLRRNNLGCEAVDAFLMGNPNQLTYLSQVHSETPCTSQHKSDSRVFFENNFTDCWIGGVLGRSSVQDSTLSPPPLPSLSPPPPRRCIARQAEEASVHGRAFQHL